MSSAIDLRGRLRRHRRLLVTLASALLLYTLAGFLIVPAIARGQLEKRLSALLRREVAVERVRLNPYTLAVTVEHLRVKAVDGAELMGFDRLLVDAKLWPVVRREIGLDAVELTNFRFRLLMLPDGSLNIEDIIKNLTAGDPAAPAQPEEPSEPWVFGVDRLAIERASVAFEDLSRGRPFSTTVGPLTIRLADFRTRPGTNGTYAFDGATEAGEKFAWSGTVGIGPLQSAGTLSLQELQLPKYSPYYERDVGFDLRGGTLGVSGSYEAEWSAQRRVFRVKDGAVGLRGLALALRGAQQPSLELPQVDVGGIQADVLAQQFEVGEVALKGGVIRARRGADGRIDLVAMGAAPGAGASPARPSTGAAPAQKTGAAGTEKAAAPKLRWLVKRVGVEGLDVRFEDALPARPVSISLAPLSVALTGLSSDRSQQARLEASAGWNGAGKLTLNGPVNPWTARAELDLHVEGLELPVLDPYLLLYGDLEARLPSGRFGLDGHATVDALAEPLAYHFTGDVRLDDLAVADALRGEELLRWKSLELLGMDVAQAPAPYVLKTIRWTEPQVRVRMGEDGSSNLARILKTPPAKPEQRPDEVPAAEPVAASSSAPPFDSARPERSAGEAGAESKGQGERAAAQPAAKAPPAPAVQYAIGAFRLQRGSVGFVDRSVKPAAVLTVSDLDVSVKNLSSQLTARSDVAVRGRIGGAPLEVTGTLSPRMVNDATNLTIKSKGVDLTPLGPYCGKYVGYELAKGKLDLDLSIKVARRNLKGQNVIQVDQLTLGDGTSSPDATKLPVKLGLAILQDKDGLIVLDVPVEGNVDDPSFRLGRVIWRAIVNVFVKMATQPFAALGALFGGGEAKLDVVEFQPGLATVAPASEKSMETLIKALTSRPGLRLDIEGVATEAADLTALRRLAVEQRAREAKWKALPTRAGLAGPADVMLLDHEYRAFVEAEYRAALPKPAPPVAGAKPQAAQPVPPPEEMEEAVLARVEIAPEALRALAQQRSEAARERLAAAGVNPARLFLTSGGERASREGGARAYFTLK
ncbi:MAG: DUF748 domain-containing protein [Anaeromyxobacter sp.]